MKNLNNKIIVDVWSIKKVDPKKSNLKNNGLKRSYATE